MRHRGADHDALRSTVGAAARLTISEDGRGPRFVRTEETRQDKGEAGPERPPVRNSRRGVPGQPSESGALYEAGAERVQ
jgi:hypothetical protein